MKQKKRLEWQDHFTRQAKKEHYPARSVFKLAEIQKKHRIIAKGNRVLDLGCAPGSWTKYAAEQTGAGGSVLGVDLAPVTIALPPQARVMSADVLALQASAGEYFGSGYQVVLSDMAPATSGDRFGDAVRSYELACAALAVADGVLTQGGRFVCKIFQGEEFKSFSDQVKTRFERMHIFKPQSSRKASREIFIIGIGKKQEAEYVRAQQMGQY